MTYQIQDTQRSDAGNVGDWRGDERLAADQFNLIQQAIALRVDDEDEETFRLATAIAWDEVGADIELLTMADQQIRGIARDCVECAA